MCLFQIVEIQVGKNCQQCYRHYSAHQAAHESLQEYERYDNGYYTYYILFHWN